MDDHFIPVLDDDQLRQMADRLEGTADSVETALQALEIDSEGLDITDVEAELSQYVERCEGCEWWYSTSDLTGDGIDDEPGLCDECRKA